MQILDEFLVQDLLLFHLHDFVVQGGDQFLSVVDLLAQDRNLLQGGFLVFLRLLEQVLGVGNLLFELLLVLLQLAAALALCIGGAEKKCQCGKQKYKVRNNDTILHNMDFNLQKYNGTHYDFSTSRYIYKQ